GVGDDHAIVDRGVHASAPARFRLGEVNHARHQAVVVRVVNGGFHVGEVRGVDAEVVTRDVVDVFGESGRSVAEAQLVMGRVGRGEVVRYLVHGDRAGERVVGQHGRRYGATTDAAHACGGVEPNAGTFDDVLAAVVAAHDDRGAARGVADHRERSVALAKHPEILALAEGDEVTLLAVGKQADDRLVVVLIEHVGVDVADHELVQVENFGFDFESG